MGYTDQGMQFTVWMSNREDCTFWFLWFGVRGVPAAVIEHESMFAVFRRGRIERKSEHGGIRLIEAKSRLDDRAKILQTCNGY